MADPSLTVPPACGDDGLQPSSEVRPREMGLILSIAAGLIISTNLLVAAAMLKMLLRKRSQSWCFVLNLALADFLVGVAITGLAAEDFSVDGDAQKLHRLPPPAQATPPEGKLRCLMRMALVMSPCTASILSMLFISLDRYAAIKMPLRYSQLSGKATAATSLLLLWLGSLMMGFLPGENGARLHRCSKVTPAKSLCSAVMVPPLRTDHYDGFCSFFSVIQEVLLVVFSACFFPVFSVFVYIYLDILKIACGHHKQIGLVRRAASRTSDQRNQQLQQPRSCFWAHAKALRTVAVLLGCFLLLWCPFFVGGMVQLLCSGCKLANVLQNHLWLLGLSNSLINPLVYAFWQKELRSQLAAMFSCFARRMSPAGSPRRRRPSVVTVPVVGLNGTQNTGRFFEQGRGSPGSTEGQEKLPKGRGTRNARRQRTA